MPPPNAVLVRPATVADVPLILSLVRELAAYEKLEHAVTATDADLAQSLFGDDPCAQALIGEVGGAAAGFALYFRNYSTFSGKPGLYLEDLFVRPAYRGRGLGLALIRAVAQQAVRRGCGRLDWVVLDWNQSAIGFYRSLGARPMADWTTYRLSGATLAGFAAGDGG